MRRRRQQRGTGIVGDPDRQRPGRARRLDHRQRVRRAPARRDADHHVVRADRGLRHRRAPRRGIILRALDALDQRRRAARHQERKPIARPVVGREQLHPILHRDAARRAGTGINQPPRRPQPCRRSLGRSGDRAHLAPDRGNGGKLPLQHRLNRGRGRPVGEVEVSRIDRFGAHCWNTLPGFISPAGSTAALIRRISATASSPCSRTSAARLPIPMPCSPVQVPPTDTA